MCTGAYPELEKTLFLWMREARKSKLALIDKVFSAKSFSLVPFMGLNYNLLFFLSAVFVDN